MSYDAMPVGIILPYGGAAAPAGWALCDGTAKSRTTFAALFAALGTAFGVGDGSTTFNLPDLRQRFPLGKAGAGTGATLGGVGGSVDHTHAVGTLANANESAHTHGVGTLANANENAHTHGVGTLATGAPGANNAMATTPTVYRDPGSTAIVGTSGAGSAHTHAISGATDLANPPFQAVNYIIKT